MLLSGFMVLTKKDFVAGNMPKSVMVPLTKMHKLNPVSPTPVVIRERAKECLLQKGSPEAP